MPNEFKAKNGVITPVIQSTATTGTAPLVVASTTRVNNLNVATAGTADTLTTARTINGTSFNGSANITVTANTPNTLTLATSGTGLSGSATFNGGSATTFTVTSNATSANTASAIVARDASGNFSAGTITAALSGNASTATTLATTRTIWGQNFNGSANVTGDLTSVGNITGTGVITISSTSADAAVINADSGNFNGRHVRFPGRVVMGSAGAGYPDIGYNFVPTSGGGWNYLANDTAYRINFGNSNRISLSYASAGTGAITWTDGFILNTSGNVGIGTTTPGSRLDVYGGAAGTTTNIQVGNASTAIQVGVDNVNNCQIRTAQNVSIIFYTNASERMRLDPFGNLGIGTSSPAYKLDVLGAVRSLISTGGTLLLGDSNNTTAIRSIPAGSDSGIGFYTQALNANPLRMTLNASGNLGLGVTPSAWNTTSRALQIGNTVAIENFGSDQSYARNAFRSATAWTYLTTSPAQIYSLESDGAHKWYIAPSGTAGTAISWTQAMTLDASGNLGVGATSPLSRLAVVQTGATYSSQATNKGTIQIVSNPTGLEQAGGLEFLASTFGNGYGWKQTTIDTGTGVDLVWARRQNSTSWSETLRIKDTGRVGIGTGSPTEILDVNGVIKTANGLLLPDSHYIYSTGGSEIGIRIGSGGPYFGIGTTGSSNMRINSSSGGDILFAFGGTNRALLISNGTFQTGQYDWYTGTEYGNGFLSPTLDHKALAGGSMVLGDGASGDVLAFRTPTTSEYWNGSAWSSTTNLPACFRARLAFNFQAQYQLTTTNTRVRWTWNNWGYHFWDAFVMSGSANGNSLFLTVETSTNGTTWVTQINDQPFGASWPGYHFYRQRGNNNASYPWLRITVRRDSTNTNTIDIANFSIIGSYQNMNRLFDWDADRNILFSGKLLAGTTGTLGVNSQIEQFQIVGTGAASSSIGVYSVSNSTTANVRQYRARAGTTVVQTGDGLGANAWFAYNGTSYINVASVNASVAEVSGSNVSAGIAFATTDISGTSASRLIINPTGAIESSNLADAVGYKGVPINSQSAAYTLVMADQAKAILHPSSDNNARTFTIPANSSVAFPVGTVITFINRANTVTIAITTDTLVLIGSGATGSRTLAANGIATAIKIAATEWVISGNGLT